MGWVMGWIALAFFIAFLVKILLDPRCMRAGVYLLLSITFAILWILLTFSESRQEIWVNIAVYALLALMLLALITIPALAVILILNGISMLRKEGRRLSNVLSLGAGFILLVEFAWTMVAVLLKSTILIAWTAVVVIPTAYFGFGFLAYVMYSAMYQLGSRLWGKPVDAVVVLGAGLINGEVTPLLANRLDRGEVVLAKSEEAGSNPIIIVSGGKGSDESRTEASAMAEYLMHDGINPAVIVEEDESRTTRENLANTAVILADRGIRGRVAVVTNNFHAFRSALLMRAAKIKGYVVGAPTARYFWPSASIREFVAIIRDHPWFTIIALAMVWLPVLVITIVLTVGG